MPKIGFVRGPMSEEHKAKISASNIGRKGTVGAGRPVNTPDVLWSKVDVRGEGECWPWKGYINSQGYGRTWVNDKGYYAHRVIFNLAAPGVISLAAPKSKYDKGFILHICDNPICCNPSHMALGDYADNARDRAAKGRSGDFKKDKGPRCLITMDQAREIRHLRATENTSTRELAERYGLSIPSIQSLIAGKTYRE